MNCQLHKLIACLPLLLATSMAFAQVDHLEAARRHVVRGAAATEMAKSEGDLAVAASEFRKATEIAPEMAIAWFNLGAVEAKLSHYAEAINAYQHYLQLSPNAEDAAKVKDEIIKLEFQQERANKRKQIAGKWFVKLPTGFASGAEFYLVMYEIAINGDLFRMDEKDFTWARRETKLYSPAQYTVKYAARGSARVSGSNPVFVGRIEGDRIVGERIRPAYLDERSTCRIDEHRAPFEGRLEDHGETLVIAFKEPRYSLIWDYVSLFDPTMTCSRVVSEQTELQEFRLLKLWYGSKPMTTVGILVAPRKHDGEAWKVKLVAGGWTDASGFHNLWTYAKNVGLREGDQVLAINGRETRKMTELEVSDQLIGENGQAVSIRVNREGWDAPVELKLAYGAAPLPDGKPLGKGVVGINLDFELRGHKGIPTWRYVIKSVIEGGAAAEAGVQPDGEVISVNGQELATRPWQEGLAILRGPPGSQATLSMRYPDGRKNEYTLIRKEEKAAKPAESR